MDDQAINSYKDLRIWQEAIVLSEDCYRLTQRFPREEMFGLTSQLRRAAVSVAANIAEGHGRESTGSFIQFLRMAQGSLKEVETHLIIAERVKIVPNDATEPLHGRCGDIGKMIRALIRTLQQKDGAPG